MPFHSPPLIAVETTRPGVDVADGLAVERARGERQGELAEPGPIALSMPRDDNSRNRALPKPWSSALLSLLLHACLLAILSFFTVRAETPSRVAFLEMRAFEAVETKLDDIPQVVVDARPVPDDQPSGGNPATAALITPASAPVVPFLGGQPSLLAFIADNRLAGGLTDEVGELDEVAGNEGVNGSGSGNGSGGGFFGIKPAGKTVVFVVDASRSMNHPHDSDAKTRFRRVKLEILNALATMDPEMSFYIIFFNIDALPMPASHPQAATPANLQRMGQWMAQLKADRETDPRRALALALRMRPDVIYFLTDGSFDKPIERELLKVSQKQTVIHTFAFGSEAGRDALRGLARANGGKFLLVP